MRRPRIPLRRPFEFLPDPRYSALSDLASRNRYAAGALSSQHSTLTVGNEQEQPTTELLRIRSAQVGTVSGGTVTVQVQADGRDIFDDTQRPVSGGTVREVTDLYLVPAGTPITTIIEADSGVPSGTANVVIETEPYTLLPRYEQVTLHRGDRLHLSRRREAELANLGANIVRIGRVARRPGDRQGEIAASRIEQIGGTTIISRGGSGAVYEGPPKGGGVGETPGGSLPGHTTPRSR